MDPFIVVVTIRVGEAEGTRGDLLLFVDYSITGIWPIHYVHCVANAVEDKLIMWNVPDLVGVHDRTRAVLGNFHRFFSINSTAHCLPQPHIREY